MNFNASVKDGSTTAGNVIPNSLGQVRLVDYHVFHSDFVPAAELDITRERLGLGMIYLKCIKVWFEGDSAKFIS